MNFRIIFAGVFCALWLQGCAENQDSNEVANTEHDMDRATALLREHYSRSLSAAKKEVVFEEELEAILEKMKTTILYMATENLLPISEFNEAFEVSSEIVSSFTSIDPLNQYDRYALLELTHNHMGYVSWVKKENLFPGLEMTRKIFQDSYINCPTPKDRKGCAIDTDLALKKYRTKIEK